jgi:hypothetical protein
MENNEEKRKNSLSLKNEKTHNLEVRLEFLNELLKNSKLEPMINTSKGDLLVDGYYKEGGSYDSIDTRVVLNKRIENFKTAIDSIGGSLFYIKSGTTGHTFKGVDRDDHGYYYYAIKVVAYPKSKRYGSIYDVRRPENAEILMIKTLSKLITDRITPHIILPYATFNTSIGFFVNLIDKEIVPKECKKYREFVDKYQKGHFYNEVSVLISEWANCGDLLDFLRKNSLQLTTTFWRVIFFQVIAALAVIHNHFPSFRHNDLKANNILLHKVSRKAPVYTYNIDGYSFRVPNIGYLIKLWDFDFSCIPGVVENAKVDSEWTKKINITPVKNRYYDMHYFFNTLINKGFVPEIMESEKISTEIKEFINRVVPSKLRNSDNKLVSSKGRILINREYTIPLKVLQKDPFFKCFRCGKSKNKVLNPPKDIKRFLKSETSSEMPNSSYKNNHTNLLERIKKIDPSEVLEGNY